MKATTIRRKLKIYGKEFVFFQNCEAQDVEGKITTE